MKHRKKSSEIILMLIYFLAALAISMAGYSIGEFDLIQKISNHNFSQEARSIGDKALKINDYTENLLKGNVLYFKFDYNQYGIYFKDSFQIPVISGRFFIPDDFLDHNPKAVVGKDILTQKLSDGKEYYLRNGTEYEVVGTLGIKKVSLLDTSVYLSVFDNSVMEWTDIIIDGAYVDENIKIYEEKYNGLAARTLDKDGIARIFNSNITGFESIFKYVGFVLVFSVISVTIFWILQKQKLILILRICGISRINIIKTIFMEYSLYALSSFIVGTAFAYFFLSSLFSFQFSIFNNVIYLFTSLFCCMALALLLSLRWANNSMGRYQR